ncbi:response regulator [Spirosoma sp. BT702]|uniref:histidine kinase n=1 Tax=Spirosoma profusum TaxID=2771354 RepID=A0A927AN97_9BACT|nr:response regulator [Spirosoma profusum]
MLLSRAGAQAPTNRLPGNRFTQPVDVNFQYLVDSTNRLALGNVVNHQSGWQTIAGPAPMLILGFTTHPVWCRFTLQQATDSTHTYAFELTNFYVDSLTLYQPDSVTGWRIQHTGDFIPFVKRNPKTRYPTLYVTLSGKKPQTCYVRVLSSQHHSYNLRVWDQNTFVSNRLPDMDRYVLFTLAFIISLFLLSLLLFMHRFAVLRAYSLWGLAVCMCSLFASSYSSIIFPTSPYWAHTSHYVTVGLLLPTLAYYVIQACQLSLYLPRLVWLYRGFGGIGLLYVGLSFFVRHPYITWGLIASLAIMMGFTLALLIALYSGGRRPAIWNVIALLLLSPIYTYFYGRNAGFFTGSFSEESLRFVMLLSTIAEPFFVVMMLWQATRERIRTADNLSLEQTQRENIQALDKLKTDFFTNVSHELRTPVTLLLGPLQTLHSRFPDNELYALMHRNASRLQTLINQLLDLAKLDARQMKNLLAPGNLASDLRTWVALFDSLAASRSITLSLHQNQDSWSAQYDADKVEKILTNLLSNAIKNTSAGGSVKVEAMYNSTGVVVEVHDTGVGIASEDLGHLFDRFYQGVGANRLEVGTGVGLALTYELVQLLGGIITVRSQLGEGTTFRVSLPIQGEVGQPVPSENGQRVNHYASSLSVDSELMYESATLIGDALYTEGQISADKPLLLLVEDNDDLRTYIRMILAPHYTLLEAKDGQQGLAMALDTIPELIVTDLMMPRLDGLDLCRALRTDIRTDHISVIMLTARAAIEDRLAGLETGADDYLTKPFLPAELLLRLQNLRRRQAALRTYWQRTLINPLSESIPAFYEVPEQERPETPAFLKQLYAVLEQHLDEPEFEVEQLADELALSSRTLTRKLKGLLNVTTRDVIRDYRLRRGNDMLDEGIQPTQVAYAVGFGSLSAFGRAYKEQYGHAPSTRKG